jgi:hypothetical protein
MKKIFALSLVVLLLAGSAWALEIQTKGDYYVRGSYIQNESTFHNDKAAADPENPAADEAGATESYSFYDHEFQATTSLKISDTTFVNIGYEIRDEQWIRGNQDDSISNDSTNAAGKSDTENQIFVDRLWGGHTFGTGTKLEVGLMTGGTWATSFGDNANGRYRIKATQPTPIGPVIAIIEKNLETGNDTVEDSEDDDNDAYYLATIIKASDALSIKPLFGYISAGTDATSGATNPDQNVDATAWLLYVGFDGTIGALGYEAEIDYYSKNYDGDAEDYSIYGAYVNVWTNMGPAKVGGMLAYGSWDNDSGKGFGFGEDFCPTWIYADNTGYGTTGLSEYMAVSLVNIYGEFAATDALTLGGSITYLMSNSDEDAGGTDNFFKDSTAWELDVTAAYKISDAVTYSVVAAYAQANLDEDAAGYDDADAAYRLFHKLKIAF